MRLSRKSGVFITEVIIAAVIFAVATTAIFLSYNASIKEKNDNILKNNEIFECVKAVEIACGMSYDDLSTFSVNSVIDGTQYRTVVTVTKYMDEYNKKEDYIKLISAVCETSNGDKSFNYSINSLKKRFE